MMKKSVHLTLERGVLEELVKSHIRSLGIEIEGVESDYVEIDFHNEEDWSEVGAAAQVKLLFSLPEEEKQ